jgi:hypothetical protein
MNSRSTNNAFTHFSGDVVSNVESSHGVQLTGGSTGGVVQAFGDDTDISLTVRGKGAGGVVLGTGTASTPLKGFFTANSTYSHGAISAARSLELTFASTTLDIMPGDLVGHIGVIVATANLSSAVNLATYRLSTAAASRVTVVLSNVQSTATSTGSGTLQVAWADLT